jgi:hypothetical protein
MLTISKNWKKDGYFNEYKYCLNECW